VDTCWVSIFSVVSTVNGPVDGVGSDVADKARRDARDGGILPVTSSRNNANSSRIPRMAASWSRSIRVISSGEKAEVERRRARRHYGEQGRRSPGMCADNVEFSHGL
jgi:hypothetical protein